MSGVEILRTERLVLRHLTEDDAAFVLELLNERGFIDNIGDRNVRDLEGARRYVSEGPGASYRTNGYGLWLTVLRATGEPVGICGLVKRDGLEDADIGYAFLERYWGQGYAREAAQASLDWAWAKRAPSAHRGREASPVLPVRPGRRARAVCRSRPPRQFRSASWR